MEDFLWTHICICECTRLQQHLTLWHYTWHWLSTLLILLFKYDHLKWFLIVSLIPELRRVERNNSHINHKNVLKKTTTKKCVIFITHKEAQHSVVDIVNMQIQICFALSFMWCRWTHCQQENCTEWFPDRTLQRTSFWLVSQQSAVVASPCMWRWKQDSSTLPAWSYVTILAHPTLLLGSLMLGGC